MSGTLEPRDSARWKTPPRARALITFGGGAGSGTVRFRVPVPDSRMRVKISVLFVPIAGNNPISGLAATLWLAEVEDSDNGTSGKTIPCTNIEGTQAAPTAIPASASLEGYSREFITAADAIEGELSATFGGSMIGQWVLQTRYQPDSVRFTREEWEELAAGCDPRVLGAAVVVP